MLTRQVAASAVADYAEHKDESDHRVQVMEGVGVVPNHWGPPTSGTGLDLSGSDECIWMVL